MDDDEIYRTFEAVLRTHGYAVMRSGGIDRIVPDVIADLLEIFMRSKKNYHTNIKRFFSQQPLMPRSKSWRILR
jgi:Holliday junction resolvase